LHSNWGHGISHEHAWHPFESIIVVQLVPAQARPPGINGGHGSGSLSPPDTGISTTFETILSCSSVVSVK